MHLGAPAITVLPGIERKDGNPWVVAGRKPASHLTDLQHPWRRVQTRAGLTHLADAHLVEAAEKVGAVIAAAMAGETTAGP